jgi:hypothetical protein
MHMTGGVHFCLRHIYNTHQDNWIFLTTNVHHYEILRTWMGYIVDVKGKRLKLLHALRALNISNWTFYRFEAVLHGKFRSGPHIKVDVKMKTILSIMDWGFYHKCSSETKCHVHNPVHICKVKVNRDTSKSLIKFLDDVHSTCSTCMNGF